MSQFKIRPVRNNQRPTPGPTRGRSPSDQLYFRKLGTTQTRKCLSNMLIKYAYHQRAENCSVLDYRSKMDDILMTTMVKVDDG